MDRGQETVGPKRLKKQGYWEMEESEIQEVLVRQMPEFLPDEKVWKDTLLAERWVLHMGTTWILRAPRLWKGFGKEG